MATTAAPVPQVDPLPELEKAAVLIAVAKTLIGYTRTVSSAKVEVKADKTMIHVTKELFKSKELQAIISADGKMDTYLKKKYFPLPPPFKRNVKMLSADLLTEVDQRLTDHAANRALNLVPAFKEKYEQTIKEGMERLGPLADPRDYLPVDEVLAAFTYTWKYMQYGTAPIIETINKAVFDRETAKTQAECLEIRESIKTMLRAQMSDMVNHMVTLLTPKEGKRQVFRKDMMKTINEFLTAFEAQNLLAGDEELRTYVDQARQLVSGVDPKLLKTNEALLTNIQTGFGQLKSQLDKMIAEAPSRKIRLSE